MAPMCSNLTDTTPTAVLVCSDPGPYCSLDTCPTFNTEIKITMT